MPTSDQPTAIVTGPTGQDGSYAVERLLDRGDAVVAVHRPGSDSDRGVLGAAAGRVQWSTVDMGDDAAVARLVNERRPERVYHFGAPSFVPASWENPVATADAVALVVARWLDAIRRYSPETRFFNASSAVVYGSRCEGRCDEGTRLDPDTPYGAAKAHAHVLVASYRERYDLFACNGILFNHESPRRAPAFVTRKITQAAARIRHGLAERVELGNLDTQRDWGFAGDTVDAALRMLEHTTAGDYVIATGQTHSVREVVERAFARAGLDWAEHVDVDPALVRSGEAPVLVGNAGKAERELGWRPRVSFEALIDAMVDADLERAAVEAAERGNGS